MRRQRRQARVARRSFPRWTVLGIFLPLVAMESLRSPSLLPLVRGFVLAPSTKRERTRITTTTTTLSTTTTTTTTAIHANLSPPEDWLLRSRLEAIKESIRNECASIVRSALDLDVDETNSNNNINDGDGDGDGLASFPTLVFPGAGGVDELVLELCQVVPNAHVIDWKKHRGTLLTAGYDSEAVGEAVGELVRNELLGSSENSNSSKNNNSGGGGGGRCSGVRFVGISVGGFAANAACTVLHKALRTQNDDIDESTTTKTTANTNAKPPGAAAGAGAHLVLLDPFCGRGVLGPNYGRDHFGRHASTALQLLNTDDPVPTTNDPLPWCYCLDVTGAPEREDFVLLPGDSMHSWPVAYFARHYWDTYADANACGYGTTDRKNEDSDLAAEQRFPRGVVDRA